jgi:hypothetical protein
MGPGNPRFVLLSEPPRLEPTPLSTGSGRLALFLSELSRHSGGNIPIVQTFLRDSSIADAFILLDASVHPSVAFGECSPELQRELRGWVVPIDVSRMGVFDMLETFSFPAAVDSLALAEGETRDEDCAGARGVYGLRDSARLIGAACVQHLASMRYCYLESERHEGLPHLLVDYLRTHVRAVGT